MLSWKEWILNWVFITAEALFLGGAVQPGRSYCPCEGLTSVPYIYICPLATGLPTKQGSLGAGVWIGTWCERTYWQCLLNANTAVILIMQVFGVGVNVPSHVCAIMLLRDSLCVAATELALKIGQPGLLTLPPSVCPPLCFPVPREQ